jgi:hypothetical protein
MKKYIKDYIVKASMKYKFFSPINGYDVFLAIIFTPFYLPFCLIRFFITEIFLYPFKLIANYLNKND